MTPYEIEIILSRQWSDYLSIPVFIVDPDGNLIYYNEPAEGILGRRFEETGPMEAREWSVIFKPVDDNGKPIPADELPLIRTLATKRPMQGSFWIHNLDERKLKLAVTSFPIIGMSDGYLGAIAIFWTNDEL